MKLIISSWFEFEADAPGLLMKLSFLGLKFNLDALFVSEAKCSWSVN